MGGHGGLNILPQKRWNVYNFDNREKVRKDEEAAAREDHIRQQQERQKESEARLAKLRDAALAKHHGKAIDDETHIDKTLNHTQSTPAEPSEDEIQHMKLFNGLISFKKLNPGSVRSEEYKGPNEVDKEIFRGDKELERLYKRAAKEATRVGKDGVEADNEHYKLGYGCLDRNKKRPWYLMKSSLQDETDTDVMTVPNNSVRVEKKQKKTIAELREERLKREQQERERARKVIATQHVAQPEHIESSDRNHRRRYYNSSFGNAR